METEAVVRIIVLGVGFGIMHWTLVPIVLESLFTRPKVVGSRALWGLAIVCLTCVGSLAYLLIHSDPVSKSGLEQQRCRDGRWCR